MILRLRQGPSGRSSARSVIALAAWVILMAGPYAAWFDAGPASSATTPGTENRIALVIGNADYRNLPALTNPVNDARDITRLLKDLNFEVILGTDVSQTAMQEAIETFGRRLKSGGVGLFYYSGHGVQVDGINYLIPVDSVVDYAEDIPTAAIDANQVLRTMASGNIGFNLVILDACRNNTLRRRDEKPVQGLARMDAPADTMIAYATGVNKVASDGFGNNSLYTGEFLKAAKVEGLRVEDVFKRVRNSVKKLSLDRQIPVEFTSMTGDFYFRPPVGGVRPATPDAPFEFELDSHGQVYEVVRDFEVRDKPWTDSRKVASVSRGAMVTATDRVRDTRWLRVKNASGAAGFVLESYLDKPFVFEVDRLDGRYLVIQDAKVRSTPRSTSRLVASLATGEAVTATGKVKNMHWLRVKTARGEKGFVLGYFLERPFVFSVERRSEKYVTARKTAVRTEPRGTSKSLASLSAGEAVTVTGKVDGMNWFRIESRRGDRGFVPDFALEKPFAFTVEDRNETYVAVADAKVWVEPRTSSAEVAKLKSGTKVTATGKVEGMTWLRIETGDGQPGFVLDYSVAKPGRRRVAALEPEPTLRSGQEFRDCKGCPLMVVIPAGSFKMGSGDGDRSERPQHEVKLRKFAIGKYEVTFEEWDNCTAEGGCPSRTLDEGWGRGKRPMVNASWDDAEQYVRWLGRKTRRQYVLPSEAQWEYAARAGTETKYAWGDSIGDNQANCDGCGSQWGGRQTAPVGQFRPNAFGLHDMHGNVWEWVMDCWHRSYRKAPTDGTAWISGFCRQTIMRGGSWRDGASLARSSQRAKYHSAPRNNFGFRIARIISD